MCKEVQKSVKLDKATHDIALRVAGDLDISYSELVRLSILVAAPNLLSNAYLKRLQAEDLNLNHILDRLE